MYLVGLHFELVFTSITKILDFSLIFCYQIFLVPLLFQDEIPELQEVFLVNITSAVLITTFATVPQLGREASLVLSAQLPHFPP